MAFDRERRVLEILPRSLVPVPRLIWADAGKEIFGVPTLTMTRLLGTPVLVHGDFHTGNLPWYRDDVAGFVDEQRQNRFHRSAISHTFTGRPSCAAT